jgi:chemotaxis protein MotA
MDLLTLVGIVLAIVAIVGGQVLEGGHVGSIMQATAAIIVLGGTIGAVMVNYPMAVFLKAISNAKMVFFNVHVDSKATIAQIVELATLGRKQGLLALEGKLKTITDPFLRKGVQLVVDGTEAKAIREILEIEVEQFEEENNLSGKVYESFGGYSPTIGILGAVLGLIHVMENLADPSKLGSGIATAFVATIYGVGAANLFFLPMGGKIKMKTKELAHGRIMIIEGLVSLAQAENPKMIEEKLYGYLPESQRPTREAAAV